jgi:hypothetical protein
MSITVPVTKTVGHCDAARACRCNTRAADRNYLRARCMRLLGDGASDTAASADHDDGSVLQRSARHWSRTFFQTEYAIVPLPDAAAGTA